MMNLVLWKLVLSAESLDSLKKVSRIFAVECVCVLFAAINAKMLSPLTPQAPSIMITMLHYGPVEM